MDAVRTPRRTKRPLSLDRRVSNETRKSLFDSVLDVTPLTSPEGKSEDELEGRRLASPSWSEDTPPRRSARSRETTPHKFQTPVKSLQNDFTQMALIARTPPNKMSAVIAPRTPQSAAGGKKGRTVGSSSLKRSPRLLNGVRELSPDRGLITPKSFYGARAVELYRDVQSDGKALYQRIRQCVRVRLPMETIPKEKKRARSSESSRNPAKRQKKLPRYRLFDEDERKPLQSTSASKRRSLSRSGGRRRSGGKSGSSPEHVKRTIEDALGTPTTARRDFERVVDSVRKSEKQMYNWQFFNTRTPPASRMHKLFSERSPSVLTPPPTSRKRKLISSYDHLGDGISTKTFGDENSSLVANSQQRVPVAPEQPSIVREICDDFSEDEIEEEFTFSKEASVDKLLEDLTKDVADVLGEDVEDITKEVQQAMNSAHKLYPIFMPDHNKPSKPLAISSCPLLVGPSASRKRQKTDANQMILDVGQRGLREVECSYCGMLYVKGDDTDEAFHDEHHQKVKLLSFPFSSNGRVVRDLISGGYRIFQIKSGDPKSWWDRAKAILEVVDTELGYPPEPNAPSQVFLCVLKGKAVGCLAARPLRLANRILPSLGLDTDLCTEEEFPVKVGISRLWVLEQHRGLGLAKALLDTLRINYSYGQILKSDDVAFSSPTEDGKKFGARYFGREDFLIYSFAPSY